MKLRNTIQRDLVFQAACHLHHPTAQQVYETIADSYPTISQGTVYRNLNLLAEMGRLLKIEVPNGADCFDSTLTGHYHIQCRICNKVSDVSLPYQKEICSCMKDMEGYIVEEHNIFFKGICPQCQKQGQLT